MIKSFLMIFFYVIYMMYYIVKWIFILMYKVFSIILGFILSFFIKDKNVINKCSSKKKDVILENKEKKDVVKKKNKIKKDSLINRYDKTSAKLYGLNDKELEYCKKNYISVDDYVKEEEEFINDDK